jgi:hypothetical protein
MILEFQISCLTFEVQLEDSEDRRRYESLLNNVNTFIIVSECIDLNNQ